MTPASSADPRSGCRAAFTLVELLVVIGIVAVLVGVLLPVFGAVRLRGDRAVAAGQMRQISTAILLYAGEHNNRLPGPLWPGQEALLDPARDGRLVLSLASYLNVPLPTTPRLVPLFIPPAYRRTMGEAFLLNDARTYVMNMAVSVEGGGTVNPWGNLAVGGQQPGPLTRVPTTAWAFCDADQQNPRVIGAPWQSSTPPQKIHGTKRLAARFDGSAGEIEDSELLLPPSS